MAPARPALVKPSAMPAPKSAQVFDVDAQRYDATRRALVPCFDAFYGNALEVIAAWGGPARPRVLDLGAGTGLFAAMVRAKLPFSSMHLVDASDSMLTLARSRFAHHGEISFGIADLAHADLAGPWDLVISALAIHHLEDADKRDLFRRIRAALAPNGLFVNAEQVLAPTKAMERLYEKQWQQGARNLGASVADIEAAKQRMLHDRCATVEDQLDWMREAGLSQVDCTFKAWRFAVLTGRSVPE